MADGRQFGSLTFGLSAGALALAIVFVLTVGVSQAAQAQTFNVIHNFTGQQDGASPHAGVTMDRAGNLYGTVQSAPAPTFTTFNAPGAGTGAYEGTAATSINSVGDVTGTYSTTGNVAHGFVRTANGAISTFDPAGAGKGNTQGTFPLSINTADAIAGYYADGDTVYHGFVRAASGAITPFDAPGAGTFGHAGTLATGINASGVIAGTYRDSNFVYHGFVRAASGAITPFDALGAGTTDSQGTKPVGINAAGAITGAYQDANYVYHGFVRTAGGAITPFDVPGSGCPGSPPPMRSKGLGPSGGSGFGSGTEPITINTAGDVAGNYTDANCLRHGFVRTADGAFATFDAPGAGQNAGMIQGTGAFSINDSGMSAGVYADANATVHGFVRAASGAINTFDVPGAGTGFFQGGGGLGINAAGAITGAYIDASSVGHSFVLTPATTTRGAAFKLTHTVSSWTTSPLYSFTGGKGGDSPDARVIFGPNGTLYSTTMYGGASGAGTVVNLKPRVKLSKGTPWIETVLYSFLNGADGAYPAYGDLIFHQAGDIYGTTAGGGTSGFGTVYQLTPVGTEKVIHSFQGGSDGATPFSGVLFDTVGNLYGTTSEGGSGKLGTVFELSQSGSGWTENVIYSFQGGSDGSYPTAGLTLDKAGNIYGATSNGGSGGGGTVFKLTPSGGSWTYSLVYSFTGGADCGPWGTLTLDAAGNLYGTTVCDGTNNAGSVFKLTHSGGGWTYSSLHDFTGGSDGKYPYSNVISGTNSNLYGTAYAGGSQGYGVVWEITP